MKKSEIVYMTRDQQIDFLMETWSDFVEQLPTGKERAFFERQNGVYLLIVSLSFGN